MQVTVTIPDEIAAHAKAAGKTTETYVQDLLASSLPLLPRRSGKVLTKEELDEFLRKMAMYSDQIPDLPDEAFTRASIYSDHD